MSASRIGRRIGLARLRAAVSVVTVTAVLAAGGAVAIVPTAAASSAPAQPTRPVVVPHTPPAKSSFPKSAYLLPSPKVDLPAVHPDGSGKQPGASTAEINALQAQLPLGPGGKGTVYVPPAVSADAKASAQAKTIGKPVEVLADRTEQNTVTANPDGSFTALLSGGIAHVQKDGSWVDTDTTLAVAADGWHPAATKTDLTLSNGGTAPAAVVSDGAGHTVTYTVTGTLPVPAVSGNAATYLGVMPNVDLVQTALTSGVEQSLVVKSRPAGDFPIWRLPVTLGGLTATANKTGGIDLSDISGSTVFESGTPTAVDATGLNVASLQQRLVTNADGSVEIDVVPDQAWLQDPATKFPVTIDPSLTETAHTFVDSVYPTLNYSTNAYMYIGRTTGTQTRRAFVAFNTSPASHASIHDATMNLHIASQANSARTTTLYSSGTISTSTTYNNQPTIGTTASGPADGTGTGGWQTIDIGTQMQTWATAGMTTSTAALKATNETDTSYAKQYDSGQGGPTYAPSITVNYNVAPTVPTSLTATQTSTFTPKLSGTSTDTYGDPVISHFYVESPGSGTPDIVNGTPVTAASGTPAAYTLPTSLVRANTTYTWWMTSCDSAGLCSAATTHQTFTIDPLLGAGSNSHFSFTSFGLTDKSGLKVNNATGNVLFQANDVSLPGRTSDVGVGRSYNSLMAASGAPISSGPGTGYGWQMADADEGLQVQTDGSVIAFFGDGSDAQFLPGCSSGFCTPNGLDADLKQNLDGTFTLTFHADQSVHTFNVNGQLTDIADRNHTTSTATTHFNYADQGCGWPQVTTITSTRGDSAGRILHVSYDTTIGGCPRTGFSQTDSASNTRSVGIGQVFSGVNYNREYTSTDAAGGVYNYDYDSNGNLSEIVTPDGHETDIAYDTSHRATTVTQDPSGIDAITHVSYPAVGEVDVQDPLGHTTKYYSDPFGQITHALDANGHTQAATWTTDHKVGSTTNAESTSGTTSFDWSGNSGESLKKTQYQASGTTTGAASTASYASAGTLNDYLPMQTTDTNSKSQYYTYDGAGNLQSNANGSGGSPDTAKATYNGDGTLASSTEPKNVAASNSTTYSYDTTGGTYNLTSVTPPTGNSISAQSFTYDGYGRIATAESGNGVTTTYTYDNLDRVTQTGYDSGDPSISTTHDADGNAIERVDGTGTTGYAYDTLNRLIGKNIGSATVTCPSSPSNTQLCYAYDSAGNLTSLSDGRGTTAYTYDMANNVTKLVEGQSGNTDLFAYNPDNQRTDTWYKATGYTYNATSHLVTAAPTGFAGHITSTIDPKTNRLTALKTSRASNNSTLAENLTVTYTAGTSDTNVRQSVTDHIPGTAVTTTYSYGTSGRLASAVATGAAPDYYYYCYDADGNITNSSTSSLTCPGTPTHSYNSANQLTDTGMSYDADGNTLASSASSPALTTLDYNGEDQTFSVLPSGGSTDYFGYAGTGQSERVVQTQPGVTDYTNGLVGLQSQTVSTASTYYERDPSGTLIAQQTPGGEYYYYTDPSGSVIGLLDTSGTQVAAYTYDPYGAHATVGAASSPNTNIANANPYRYTGTYYDFATGLYQMGARYYDPTLGRFTQLDPSGHLLDLRQGNRYSYAGDDPINNADPTGKDFFDDFATAVSDTAGAVATVADFIPGGEAVGVIAGAVSVGADLAKTANDCIGGDSDEKCEGDGEADLVGISTFGLASAGTGFHESGLTKAADIAGNSNDLADTLGFYG